MGCGMPPVRAVGDVSLHPPSPCHWLAPDAAAVALGLMVPVAAGLLIVPLAPVAALPASALVSARLHPAVPIASSTADAAIAMYFVAGFIAHASWYCLEPGPGPGLAAPWTSGAYRDSSILRTTFSTASIALVRNEFGAGAVFSAERIPEPRNSNRNG